MMATGKRRELRQHALHIATLTNASSDLDIDEFLRCGDMPRATPPTLDPNLQVAVEQKIDAYMRTGKLEV
jgi:hypothetical protein